LNNPVLEILIILLLLVANGIFAMSEAAVISARKARLQQLAEAGNAQARAALELATHPNQFLGLFSITWGKPACQSGEIGIDKRRL